MKKGPHFWTRADSWILNIGIPDCGPHSAS